MFEAPIKSKVLYASVCSGVGGAATGVVGTDSEAGTVSKDGTNSGVNTGTGVVGTCSGVGTISGVGTKSVVDTGGTCIGLLSGGVTSGVIGGTTGYVGVTGAGAIVGGNSDGFGSLEL